MSLSRSGLILGVPPQRGLRAGPTRPALLANTPWARPVEYASIAALAQAVQRLRTAGGRERGLQLVPDMATWDASDSFPVFKVLVSEALDGADDGAHVATIAVQGVPLERVMHELAAANPLAPADRRTAA
jgi:hypothetical protein